MSCYCMYALTIVGKTPLDDILEDRFEKAKRAKKPRTQRTPLVPTTPSTIKSHTTPSRNNQIVL